jgi:hypothetical protein
MYGATRPATPDEVNSVRVSQHLQAVAYVYQLCAELDDPRDSLLVIYGLHPPLRPWLSELFKQANIVVPPDDKAYAVAVMILTARPEERDELKRRGEEKLARGS